MFPQTAFDSPGDLDSRLVRHEAMITSYPLLTGAKHPPLPAIFERIAFCESSGRQFDETGKVVRGIENPDDVGKYQINISYWGDEAKKRGYDLFTEDGNEAMAFELYKRFHTSPWGRSQVCWE